MTDARKLARLGIHVLDGGALSEEGSASAPRECSPSSPSALREEGPLDREPTHPTPRVPGHGRSLTAGGRLSSSRSAPDVGVLAVTSTAPDTTVLPGELVRAGAPLDVFISSAKRARFTITVAVWAVLVGLSLAAWAFVGFLVYLGAFT